MRPDNFCALLLDADGTLFPSEEPAYHASAEITNGLLGHLGVSARYTGDELRREHTGKNFRLTAQELCRRHGVTVATDELELWVDKEKQAVTAHLSAMLRPSPELHCALGQLQSCFTLAVVTSSAAGRLDACLSATGLGSWFGDDRRFSAEDSLPVPIPKPDPAVYRLAASRLGTKAFLAVEDSVAGVESAVAAGIPTIGLTEFVPSAELEDRRAALLRTGAVAVHDSWQVLSEVLLAERDPARSVSHVAAATGYFRTVDAANRRHRTDR